MRLVPRGLAAINPGSLQQRVRQVGRRALRVQRVPGRGEVRVHRAPGGEAGLPGLPADDAAGADLCEVRAHVVRDPERRLERPAQALLGLPDLVGAQWRTVGGLGPFLGGRALGDDSPRDDQGRARRFRGGGVQGRLDGRRVVPPDVLHVPAHRGEARPHVLVEGQVGPAFDRDAVRVVHDHEVPEAEGPGQRSGLVRDAFHHVAVAGQRVHAVVHGTGAGGVRESIDSARGGSVSGESFLRKPVAYACALGQHPRGQHAPRQRHAHGIREALPQRPGGRFDAWAVAELGMPRGHAVPLAEPPQFVQRQVVPGQVQHRVLQHRGVADRQHEPVPVGPVRLRRVVPHRPGPQHQGQVGGAHGRPGMAGLRGLHGVHGQHLDRPHDAFAQRGIGNHRQVGHVVVPPNAAPSAPDGRARGRPRGPRRGCRSGAWRPGGPPPPPAPARPP